MQTDSRQTRFFGFAKAVVSQGRGRSIYVPSARVRSFYVLTALALFCSVQFAAAQKAVPENTDSRPRAHPNATPVSGGSGGAGRAPDAILASQTWDGGGVNSLWTNTVNWVGDTAVAGAASGTANGDTATFNNAVNTSVTIDATRNIKSITFDTVSAGAFTFSSGGLFLTNAGAITINSTVANSETINTPITLSPTASATYSFINNSTNAGVILTIGGTVTGGAIATGTETLTVGGAGNGAITNTISNNVAGRTVAVTKTDAGTWTFSGANTYTAATTVNGGTLLINGTQSSATGAVSVNNSGSVLGGTGTIGGAVTVNQNAIITGGTRGTGGTIVTGNIGTLTLSNNLTFTGASGNLATYLVDIGSGTNNSDRLTIGGALSLSNGFDQILFNGTPDGTSSYILASATGGITGTFDFGSAPAGYQFVYTANELDLTPVPEPSTWIAGALAFGFLGWSQRKRLKRSRK